MFHPHRFINCFTGFELKAGYTSMSSGEASHAFRPMRSTITRLGAWLPYALQCPHA